MRKSSFIGKEFITNNFLETQKLGHDFAQILEGGDIVCLYGDLGSGKTTFTQGLAEGLGIKNRIISPSFVIVRSHELKTGMFYHVDLYRTESEKDIEGLGFEEMVSNKNNIIVIEWAEKLINKIPQNRIEIEFFYQGDDARKIMFRACNQ